MLFLLIAAVLLYFIVSYFVNKPSMKLPLPTEEKPPQEQYEEKRQGTAARAYVYVKQHNTSTPSKKSK